MCMMIKNILNIFFLKKFNFTLLKGITKVNLCSLEVAVLKCMSVHIYVCVCVCAI